MKKNAVLLVMFLISINGFLFCQEARESLGDTYVYPQFHESFSAEESWGIHKEAYLKQLKAEGLSVNEVEQKMAAYETRKVEFIKKVTELRKTAAIQREHNAEQADEQMRQSALWREKVGEQSKKTRDFYNLQRQKTEEQTKESQEEIKKFKEEAERFNSEMKEQSQKTAEFYNLQRQKTEEHRKQRKEELDKFNKEAEDFKNEAEIFRREAEERQKLYKDLKNNSENILTEQITISRQISNIEPLLFNVNKTATLLFTIDSNIRLGIVLIEIFNPKGKKEGEFILENKALNNEGDVLKSTSDFFKRMISTSEIGEWQIIISPQKSEGIINIAVSQYVQAVLEE